jgi:hypothetical protein
MAATGTCALLGAMGNLRAGFPSQSPTGQRCTAVFLRSITSLEAEGNPQRGVTTGSQDLREQDTRQERLGSRPAKASFPFHANALGGRATRQIFYWAKLFTMRDPVANAVIPVGWPPLASYTRP